ncbi:hypothetical protein ACG3PX_14550 [Pseudomonas aeruginosa]
MVADSSARRSIDWALPCTSSTRLAQAAQALADHPLAMLHCLACAATGVGGLAGVSGDLLDRRFHVAEGVADLPGIAGLALDPGVQAAADLGQGLAAAGDLFGAAVDRADQLGEEAAQAVQRIFQVAQVLGAGTQGYGAREVAVGPGRERRHQLPEDPRQASLQAVDGEGDEQDQGDHPTLDQAYLALQALAFAAHLRFQGGQGLAHRVQSGAGVGGQLLATLDQVAGAAQLVRIALQQAGEFAPQRHAAVFGIAGASLGVAGQPHHGGEVVAGRALLVEHAEQRQGLDPPGLLAQVGQFALDVAGQGRVGAFHQLGAGQAEAGQVQAGEQQRGAVGAGLGLPRRGVQVGGPLFQVAGEVALGL